MVARVAGRESRGHGEGKTGGAARSRVAVSLVNGMVEAGQAMQRGCSTDGQGQWTDGCGLQGAGCKCDHQ